MEEKREKGAAKELERERERLMWSWRGQLDKRDPWSRMVKDGQGREEPRRGANKTQDVRVIYMPSPKIDGGRRQSAGCRKRDAG